MAPVSRPSVGGSGSGSGSGGGGGVNLASENVASQYCTPGYILEDFRVAVVHLLFKHG